MTFVLVVLILSVAGLLVLAAALIRSLAEQDRISKIDPGKAFGGDDE
jgi:hypothetical protein